MMFDRENASTAAAAATMIAIVPTTSARLRLRLALARTRRELPPCGRKGDLLTRVLSSSGRIAQRPDDANRQDHKHDHREHALHVDAELLDARDR